MTVKGLGLPGAYEISQIKWIKIQTPAPELVKPLTILVDAGEAQAIALAQTTSNCIILIDDARAARDMGRELAAAGLTCIFGGSDTGLMKLLADSVLESGGKVVGVTVQALRDKEIFHPGLTELHVVSTMNERKALMVELSDGFVALPGGVGTFEEFFEIYTLSLLGFHSKPFGLLNINNYYAPLDSLLDHAEREEFLKAPQALSMNETNCNYNRLIFLYQKDGLRMTALFNFRLAVQV